MDHSVEHVREISSTLYKYHLDNFLCDVFVVLPDGTEVPAHSVVLSAVSVTFHYCQCSGWTCHATSSSIGIILRCWQDALILRYQTRPSWSNIVDSCSVNAYILCVYFYGVSRNTAPHTPRAPRAVRWPRVTKHRTASGNNYRTAPRHRTVSKYRTAPR